MGGERALDPTLFANILYTHAQPVAIWPCLAYSLGYVCGRRGMALYMRISIRICTKPIA